MYVLYMQDRRKVFTRRSGDGDGVNRDVLLCQGAIYIMQTGETKNYIVSGPYVRASGIFQT